MKLLNFKFLTIAILIALATTSCKNGDDDGGDSPHDPTGRNVLQFNISF